MTETGDEGFDLIGTPSNNDARGPEIWRGPFASMLVSDDSDDSDDSDLGYKYRYSFPPKKVKLQRMKEKRIKRQAKTRNKQAASKPCFASTQRDVDRFVDVIEEYKYKFHLIFDDDYLFLLSILPTLINLEPLEKFRICQGINEILIGEANKILERFHECYWTRADKYKSSLLSKQTKYSLLARSSQLFRSKARLLQLVKEKLRFIEEYKDDRGLDNDEVFFYLMCNLPIIVMYDPSQKLIIRHAIYEKLIQVINNALPVTSTDQHSKSDDDDNKMELRVLILRTVKIVDLCRIESHLLEITDKNYLFLIRILHAVKYLKLEPKLRLFDGIIGLLINETTSNEALAKQGKTSSESESSQSQSQITLKDPARDEVNESMRLIEEKLQIIENRIRNNEFSMELRKDGDYLFFISIHCTIEKLTQLQKVRLFNGILGLLNVATRSKDCLFSVCEQ